MFFKLAINKNRKIASVEKSNKQRCQRGAKTMHQRVMPRCFTLFSPLMVAKISAPQVIKKLIPKSKIINENLTSQKSNHATKNFVDDSNISSSPGAPLGKIIGLR